VKPIDGGLEVTGDLTLHGVTKAVVLKLEGGGAAEFPPGVHRTGYTTNVIIKRSEFGMATMVGPVSDEVYLSISFEGIRK
jgi:polyisoprenoid-binding protein YceI